MRFIYSILLAAFFLFHFSSANAQKREADKVIYNAFIEKASVDKLKENLKQMSQSEKDQLIITTDEPKLLRVQQKDNSVYYMIIFNDEGKPVELWNCFKSRTDMMFTKAELKEQGYEQGDYSALYNPKTNIKITSSLRAIDGKNCECLTFTIPLK